jgi:RNA polymerase sigma-70 factor (ECF subfamily)
VHLKCDDFESGRPFRPWLFAIATRQAIDALRRCSRQRLVSVEGFRDDDGEEGGDPLAEMATAPPLSVGARMDAEETNAMVRTAVDGLSPAHRHVVTLVYYEGAKYRDVARILGIPLGTVKSRLHAALRALAVAYGGV